MSEVNQYHFAFKELSTANKPPGILPQVFIIPPQLDLISGFEQ